VRIKDYGITGNQASKDLKVLRRGNLLVVVVELSYLGRDLSDLPTLESVAGVQDDPVLLLELPQLRVDVKRPAKVSLKERPLVDWHRDILPTDTH